MRKTVVLVALLALVAFPLTLAAQTADTHQMQGPPKVLQIIREDSKPGKVIAHRKHEAAWTQAFTKAGYPYNLTLSSVTGPDEDWFMTGFDSYAQLEKTADKFETAEYEKIMDTFLPKESEFVSKSSLTLAKYRPDLSYKPDFKLGEYRYFHVAIVRCRLGVDAKEIYKVLNAARAKANLDMHGVVYEVQSGMPVGTYLAFYAVKSLSQWDEPENKEYEAALAESNFQDILGKLVSSVEFRLFAFNPRLSHVSEDVAKANPSFWNPKPEMAMTGKKAAPAKKEGAPAKKEAAPAKKEKK